MKPALEIDRLLHAQHGVVVRADHPELHSTFDWLLRNDRIVTVVPGVYARPEAATDLRVRLRAAARRYPDGVFVGATAAHLSYWPEARFDAIEMALPDTRRPPRGFAFTHRRIPPELITTRGGLRITTPALTAIDTATEACADAIDIALRSRQATLPEMYEALQLTTRRPGNHDRRQLLIDSRDEPWSAAERQAHRILRAAGITGWIANHPVIVADQGYYIDVAFEAQRLALEVDGRLHEDEGDLFESDRRRQNALVLSGWRVIRFTWAMLRDEPEFVVATIRRALRP